MPAVSFESIKIGGSYSRTELADIWGYASHQAISRGLVTPRRDNKIILFITRERRSSDEQYQNELSGETLTMDGPNDHFAEGRMIDAGKTSDEVHLFYRTWHRDQFTYYGQVDLASASLHTNKPSRFEYRIRAN